MRKLFPHFVRYPITFSSYARSLGWIRLVRPWCFAISHALTCYPCSHLFLCLRESMLAYRCRRLQPIRGIDLARVRNHLVVSMPLSPLRHHLSLALRAFCSTQVRLSFEATRRLRPWWSPSVWIATVSNREKKLPLGSAERCRIEGSIDVCRVHERIRRTACFSDRGCGCLDGSVCFVRRLVLPVFGTWADGACRHPTRTRRHTTEQWKPRTTFRSRILVKSTAKMEKNTSEETSKCPCMHLGGESTWRDPIPSTHGRMQKESCPWMGEKRMPQET